jgi:hypothetical protein
MLRAFASKDGIYNVDELFLERQKDLSSRTASQRSPEEVGLPSRSTDPHVLPLMKYWDIIQGRRGVQIALKLFRLEGIVCFSQLRG